MKDMHNPPHPGKLVKSSLEFADMTIAKAAEDMDISRKHLSGLINASARITPDMSKRLEAYIGSTARTWLAMQDAYDLWQLRDVKYDIKQVANS